MNSLPTALSSVSVATVVLVCTRVGSLPSSWGLAGLLQKQARKITQLTAIGIAIQRIICQLLLEATTVVSVAFFVELSTPVLLLTAGQLPLTVQQLWLPQLLQLTQTPTERQNPARQPVHAEALVQKAQVASQARQVWLKRQNSPMQRVQPTSSAQASQQLAHCLQVLTPTRQKLRAQLMHPWRLQLPQLLGHCLHTPPYRQQMFPHWVQLLRPWQLRQPFEQTQQVPLLLKYPTTQVWQFEFDVQLKQS